MHRSTPFSFEIQCNDSQSLDWSDYGTFLWLSNMTQVKTKNCKFQHT